MHLILKNGILIILCGLVAGCAGRTGPTNFEQIYTPPKSDKIFSNTVILNQNFEETWNQIVSTLSSKYFVINNIEKNSRIMNVSFSVAEPQKYVDCGRNKITVQLRKGGTLEKEYEVTKSVTIPHVYPKLTTLYYADLTGYPAIVGTVADYGVVQRKRWTSVSGRSNIYVAPNGKNKTEISVNTKFEFGVNDRKIATVGENTLIAPFTVSYTTNSPGKTVVLVLKYVDPRNVPERFESRVIERFLNIGAKLKPIYEFVEVRCVSKFVVERDILDAAKIN